MFLERRYLFLETRDFTLNTRHIHSSLCSSPRWEVDEVLVSELARNLLLALAMVSLTSLVLLADLRATVLVLASVILTLVDVVGLMYYWGIR